MRVTGERVLTQVRDEAANVRFVHFHQRLRTPHLRLSHSALTMQGKDVLKGWYGTLGGRGRVGGTS